MRPTLGNLSGVLVETDPILVGFSDPFEFGDRSATPMSDRGAR